MALTIMKRKTNGSYHYEEKNEWLLHSLANEKIIDSYHYE